MCDDQWERIKERDLVERLLQKLKQFQRIGDRLMPSFENWRRTWTRLGASVADSRLFADVRACYSEPHRKYHTIQHLDECFEKLEELRADAIHPGEIELALWFHDAIYDVKRQDNEEKSAGWARASVLAAGLSRSSADRVHALIMATGHNAVPSEPDEAILVDVDLSILGAAPARFDEYEKQIREEYSWVPGFLFRTKRRSILKEFLARPTIFNTRKFVVTYEARARENLERSISKLDG